jgi:TPR repeat protein
MSYFFPLSDKIIQKSSSNISNNNEIFLKEFLIEFHRKIIDMNNINNFENILSELINVYDKSTKSILELMKNHKKKKFWFSSIMGFFYQYGIYCNIDKDMALESYLLAIKNDEFSDHKFNDDNDDNDEFIMFQNINSIIGKYLLSLYYYKDIILDIRNLDGLSDLVIKYLKSARKGDPIDQYNLGTCYQYGKGIAQDYNKAFEWYFKSANNGYAKSQCNLGLCYYYGRGTIQDYKKAFEWYFKSANNGCAKGQNNLGYCYQYGKGVKLNYEKAFDWYYKSANNGYARGQYNLGYCYYDGKGINQDYDKAFEWYLRSANNGHAMSKNNLGYCYEYGEGVSQDYIKAFEWYLKSAIDGCDLGQYNLGYSYYNGIGTRINIDEAIFWYKKALENGIEGAYIELNKILSRNNFIYNNKLNY